MTTKKTHACDLCTLTIQPSDDLARGIHWTNDHKIEWRAVPTVEHHLCGKCFMALREAIHR